jgi:hypothetical protein
MTAERIIAALRWVATAKRAAATAAVKPVLIQDPRGISFARFPHSAVATERDLSPRVERAGCAEQAYETANPVRANAFELTRIVGNGGVSDRCVVRLRSAAQSLLAMVGEAGLPVRGDLDYLEEVMLNAARKASPPGVYRGLVCCGA